MSLHEVNPTGFIFLVFSYLQLCIYKLQKSLCQAQLKIRSKHLAWRNKANKPNFTFITAQTWDQRSGVSRQIPGVSRPTNPGVSGKSPGISGQMAGLSEPRPVRPVSTTGQTGPTCPGHTTGQTGPFDRSYRSYRTKPQLSYRTLVQLPNLI